MSKGDTPRVKTQAEQFSDTYRAGLIAGLREAAEIAGRRFDGHSGFGTARGLNYEHAGDAIAKSIRARIDALEEEGEKR